MSRRKLHYCPRLEGKRRRVRDVIQHRTTNYRFQSCLIETMQREKRPDPSVSLHGLAVQLSAPALWTVVVSEVNSTRSRTIFPMQDHCSHADLDVELVTPPGYCRQQSNAIGCRRTNQLAPRTSF